MAYIIHRISVVGLRFYERQGCFNQLQGIKPDNREIKLVICWRKRQDLIMHYISLFCYISLYCNVVVCLSDIGYERKTFDLTVAVRYIEYKRNHTVNMQQTAMYNRTCWHYRSIFCTCYKLQHVFCHWILIVESIAYYERIVSPACWL